MAATEIFKKNDGVQLLHPPVVRGLTTLNANMQTCGQRQRVNYYGAVLRLLTRYSININQRTNVLHVWTMQYMS